MVGLGIQGLIHGAFTPIWFGVPRGVAGRDLLAYLCALISLASGLGLLVQRTSAIASRGLLTWLLAWLLVVRVPSVILFPVGIGSWWGFGDTAVMAAAAWVLYANGDKGQRIAKMLYGLGLVPFGVAHFTNLKDTVVVIPDWLPFHVALAYLTGAAFIAAGAAVMSGVYARLAATLSTLQMGLFTLIVWVPIVVAGPSDSQWAEFVNSWSLTAAGWVVADSYRGTRWLAMGNRSA